MDPASAADRGRKARGRKGDKADGPNAEGKVKSSCYLTVEADQRLGVHAAMLRIGRSELLERLITDHLRTFVVQRRGGAPPGGVSAIQASEANLPVETVPISEGIHPSPIVDLSASPGAGEGGPDPSPAAPPRKRRA